MSNIASTAGKGFLLSDRLAFYQNVNVAVIYSKRRTSTDTAASGFSIVERTYTEITKLDGYKPFTPIKAANGTTDILSTSDLPAFTAALMKTYGNNIAIRNVWIKEKQVVITFISGSDAKTLRTVI